MARPARPWFRFYVEAVHDRKLRRLPPEQRWLFVACLAAARQSPEPGWLLVGEDDPMTWDDLVDFAAMSLKAVERGTDALCDAGVLAYDETRRAWNVPSWCARQYESDDVTARTRKHRERSKEPDKNVPKNVPGTSKGTPPETEADTETETEVGTTLAPTNGARKPDPVWDALLAVCGVTAELTKTERGRFNAAAKELRDAGATASEVRRRAAVFRGKWPSITLTPNGLAGRWGECERNGTAGLSPAAARLMAIGEPR